jgi:hypothetical protein
VRREHDERRAAGDGRGEQPFPALDVTAQHAGTDGFGGDLAVDAEAPPRRAQRVTENVRGIGRDDTERGEGLPSVSGRREAFRSPAPGRREARLQREGTAACRDRLVQRACISWVRPSRKAAAAE